MVEVAQLIRERTSAPDIVTEAMLLDRARALVPALMARAAQAAADRCIPVETIEDFRKAGFFRILQPVEYGGLGMKPITLCRVIQELGRGCMSSGWISFVLGLHPYEVTLMGDAACRRVWGDNPDARVASSYAPLGAIAKVEGGYRLNGTWRFSSGINHAQFIVVGGMVKMEGQERPDYIACLVPKTEFQIDDSSWNTFGLSGTGSKDVKITDVFVPDALGHSLIKSHLMVGQENLPPTYRYPLWAVFGLTLASAVIGGARGALDEFISQMRVRTANFDTGNGRPQAADDPFVRQRLGQATMLVRGAIARIDSVCAEMTAKIDAGQPMPIEERIFYTTEAAQCGRMSEEAVLLLFKATGARGLDLGNRMQMILRNVLSGANHIGMNVDGTTTNLGGVLLGKDNTIISC